MDELSVLLLLRNVNAILGALTAVLSLIYWQRKPQYLKAFALLLTLSAISNLLGYILVELGITPNYAGSIYYIIALPLITAVYYFALDKKYQHVFLLIIALYIGVGLFNLFFFQRTEINSYTKLLMSIIVIFYTLYYFYWLLNELPITKLHLFPMFWINSGFMAFFSGTMFLFGLTTYIINVLKDSFIVYWIFHNVLGIVQLLMFIVALLLDLKKLQPKN